MQRAMGDPPLPASTTTTTAAPSPAKGRETEPESAPRDATSEPQRQATATATATAPAAASPPAVQAQQKQPAPEVADLVRAAADRTLSFLSTADNGTLGACLVGLGATTYVVLGRVGLVLIGVVGGVVLHATWEGGNGRDGAKADDVARRREAGVEVARRLMDWRRTGKPTGRGSARGSQSANDDSGRNDDKNDRPNDDNNDDNDDDDQHNTSPTQQTSDFASFRPDTAAALNELTDAIVRDYVKWWYSPILPADLAFPAACRQVMAGFISSLSTNISRKRPADAFLEFTTNSSSVVIVVLNELTLALSASPGSSAEIALRTYLDMKPQSNLANILDDKHQARKLKMVADDILENYLDPSLYRCGPTRIFLREVLANVVLEMTIQTCSRADWINEWIIYLLEDGEPEIMREIDAGVESLTPQGLGLGKDVALDPAAGLSVQKGSAGGAKGDHKRRVSRAEEAMDEAMREAQRLTQMIVEEDERKAREQRGRDKPDEPMQPAQSQTDLSEVSDSTNTNHNVHTPTSSQSDTSGDVPPKAASPAPSRPLSYATPDVEQSPVPRYSPVQSQPLPVVDETAPLTMTTTTMRLSDEPPRPATSEPLTLRDARINILDDLLQGDKRPLKSKPAADYLIQVEPASSHFSGWMISRTYSDFEVLHEVLRRISTISGCTFTQGHADLPAWKGISKAYLKDELERYLADAVKFVPLAESEGMKRFLEQNRGLQKTPPTRSGFWPNPANVGKGMLDVLSKAPKEVAGGGKALFGNVQSAFGAQAARTAAHPSRGASMSSGDVRDVAAAVSPQQRHSMIPELSSGRPTSSAASPRPSLDSRSSSFIRDVQPRPGSQSQQQPPLTAEGLAHKLDLSLAKVDQPRRRSETPEMTLPPRPDQIPDDYSHTSPRSNASASLVIPEHISHMSVDGTSFFEVPAHSPSTSPNPASSPTERRAARAARVRLQSPAKAPSPSPSKRAKPPRVLQPLQEQEAQVTVELLFAVISELYQLSSAWNIRRTLLTAAKTFLLRPGNPQLESIRVLLQESVLDANTSDAGVAAHVRKLRQNCMPTPDERARWPAERSARDSQELRERARRLLVQRGMPQALTSVMGQAASGECLGKVFDCLQAPDVARGVMFGLMLQLVRAVTQ